MSSIYIPPTPEKGLIKGLMVPEYTSATEVELNPGEVEANGKLYKSASTIVHSMKDLASAVGYQYFYLDVSESKSNDIVIYNSLTPPAWDASRKGFYSSVDTEDRMLDELLSPPGEAIVDYFVSFPVTRKYIRKVFTTLDLVITTALPPTGNWQDPNTAQSDVYTPVNAVEGRFRLVNNDPAGGLVVSIIDLESSSEMTSIYDSKTRASGYNNILTFMWVWLKESRQIQVGGEPDDSGLDIIIVGYGSRRGEE